MAGIQKLNNFRYQGRRKRFRTQPKWHVVLSRKKLVIPTVQVKEGTAMRRYWNREIKWKKEFETLNNP